jgi:uncharacterized protein YkwD
VIPKHREVPVHYRPEPPPLSQRLAGVLSRFLHRAWTVLRPAGAGSRHRSGRLALGALVSTVVTALVLSVPVISGAEGGAPFVALDSFAATSAAPSPDGDSPVVMGRDGRPESSAASGTTSPTPAAGSPTDAATGPAPTTTGSVAPPADGPAATPSPSEAPPAAGAPPVGPESPASEAPAPAAAAVPAGPDAEGQVLALVNAERARAGCGTLAADAALASVARAHSADMRDRDFFDDVNPDQLDPFDRAERAGIDVRAESIAHGQPDAAAVVESWMRRSGDRENILDCSLTRLGVGMAEGHGGPWWTQLLA